MPEILTCRLQFVLVGTVFQSEPFHTVEAARAVGMDLQRHITARVSIVDNYNQTVEALQ